MTRALLERELRVAFSPRVQPMWLRVSKWIVFLGVAAWLRQTRPHMFRRWLVGLPLVGVIVHMIFRWKTHGWTQPWGGWNDLAAAQR